MRKYDVVVIGGGPAGITLAKMLGKKFSIAIIRPENHSMIYCAMPYAVGGIIDTAKTFKKDALVTESGAELIRSTLKCVDVEMKRLELIDGSVVGFDKLVIATGAEPFIPPVKGRELPGVHVFKTEQDMTAIYAAVENGLKKAVIVGAGAIGIELALALANRGISVDLVDMEPTILPNLIDADMATGLDEELIRAGISLHLGQRLTGLYGDLLIEKVILDNGVEIVFRDADTCTEKPNATSGIVIFATGMVPVIPAIKNGVLHRGKYGIIVDNRLRTSIDDIYAAGDCVQFASGITGRPSSGKLATNAVPMAKIVGFNISGKHRVYPGFYNGAATRVHDYFVGGTGLTERIARQEGIETVCGYGKVTTQFPMMPDAKKLTIKLIAEKTTNRLVGGQVVSGAPVTDKVDLMTFAIQKQSTAEDLAALSYSAQPYQSFFPAANGVVLAAEEILMKN